MECYLFKIICVGDTKTGKSHFLESMHQMMHSKKHNTPFTPLTTISETIGMQFYHKLFEHEGRRLKVHFWDLSGQKRFREIVQTYFAMGDMVLYFFNVADIDSFYAVKEWMDAVRKSVKEETPKLKGHTFRPLSIIIGNRRRKHFIDCFPSRKACMTFCNRYRLKYIEYDGSLKSLENICFHICNDLMRQAQYIYRFKYRKNQIHEEINPCRFVFRKNTLSTNTNTNMENPQDTHQDTEMLTNVNTPTYDIPLLNSKTTNETHNDHDNENDNKNEFYINVTPSPSNPSELSEDELLCVDETIVYDKTKTRMLPHSKKHKDVSNKDSDNGETKPSNNNNNNNSTYESRLLEYPGFNETYSSSDSIYTAKHYMQVMNLSMDSDDEMNPYKRTKHDKCDKRYCSGMFCC